MEMIEQNFRRNYHLFMVLQDYCMINNQQHSNNPRDQSGVYAFDLKLNVDFNSGHLSLNVPPHAPFAKKMYSPILINQPLLGRDSQVHYIPYSNDERTQIYYPQNPPAPRVVSPNQYEVPRYSVHSQPKHTESLNTTSFRVQQIPQGVQCVICQKLIRQDAFSQHLEEHRNRKKVKARISASSSQISIRNKDDEAEIAEIVNNNLQSYNQIPHSLNFSDSSKPNSSIRSNSSHTVILPIMQENPQTIYQNPSYSQTHNRSFANESYSNSSSFRLSQPSASKPINQISNPKFSLSSRSHETIPQNLHYIPIQEPPPKAFPPQRQINILKFHRIQSMIIRPEVTNKQSRGLEDCGQSVISRNSLPTKYSQIHALQQELQSKSRNNDSSSSSQSQQQLKGYPSKFYRSGPEIKQSQRSSITEKLSKTKLPVNYLAREEFITISTNSTNSRRSKNAF